MFRRKEQDEDLRFTLAKLFSFVWLETHKKVINKTKRLPICQGLFSYPIRQKNAQKWGQNSKRFGDTWIGVVGIRRYAVCRPKMSHDTGGWKENVNAVMVEMRSRVKQIRSNYRIKDVICGRELKLFSFYLRRRNMQGACIDGFVRLTIVGLYSRAGMKPCDLPDIENVWMSKQCSQMYL